MNKNAETVERVERERERELQFRKQNKHGTLCFIKHTRKRWMSHLLLFIV